MSDDLIDDCKQAFANPFRHPGTGATENISTFYAVNGGSISEQGTTNFFNSCVRIGYGGNVRLLDGKALVALDRWASFNRGEMIGETLTGMLIEIRFNRRFMPSFLEMIENNIRDSTAVLPIERLRVEAATNYLIRPVCTAGININMIEANCMFIDGFNNLLTYCQLAAGNRENKVQVLTTMRDNSVAYSLRTQEIEGQILEILTTLGPIAGM